jgi:hypothetical protein
MAAKVVLRDSASDALDQLQRAAAPAIKQGKRQAGALLISAARPVRSRRQ